MELINLRCYSLRKYDFVEYSNKSTILKARNKKPLETWTYEKLQEKGVAEMPEAVRDGRKIRLDKLRKHIEFKL